MNSSWLRTTAVPTIMRIETLNWKVISTFLSTEWEAPVFSAPVSTATGLKEESRKAGYPPAAKPTKSVMIARAGTSQAEP